MFKQQTERLYQESMRLFWKNFLNEDCSENNLVNMSYHIRGILKSLNKAEFLEYDDYSF